MKKRTATTAKFVIGLLVTAIILGVVAGAQEQTKLPKALTAKTGTQIAEVSNSAFSVQVQDYLLQDLISGRNDYVYSRVDISSIPADVEVEKFVFLSEGNNTSVIASESERSFLTEEWYIDPSYKDQKYHNSDNTAKGVFAYQYGDEVAAIIMMESDFQVSSVWALYQKDGKEVATQVWHASSE